MSTALAREQFLRIARLPDQRIGVSRAPAGNASSQTPAVDRRRSHYGHRCVDALVMPKERALGSTRREAIPALEGLAPRADGRAGHHGRRAATEPFTSATSLFSACV